MALISSMANDSPIDHVIRGHKATLQFNREGFVVTPQESIREDLPAPADMKAHEVRLLVYRKSGAEEVKLHHRNLHSAIRNGKELHCDVMLGYYGVVAACMGVQSFRKRSYLKWNLTEEKVEKA